jgi:hypothetical protein
MSGPGVLHIAAGRVAVHCVTCRCVVATISEMALRSGAALTPWRALSSSVLADKITDAAAVKCPDCEDSQLATPTPTH